MGNPAAITIVVFDAAFLKKGSLFCLYFMVRETEQLGRGKFSGIYPVTFSWGSKQKVSVLPETTVLAFSTPYF